MPPTDSQIALLHYYAQQSGYAASSVYQEFVLVPFGMPEASIMTDQPVSRQGAAILINHLVHGGFNNEQHYQRNY